MIVNFHLPGLRQNYPLNMLILNLLKTKPDWFREGVRIASFFGEFPTSLWNGGRPSNYDQCDASFIQNVIKNINAKLSEYIMPYVSSDNKKYMTLSLELIVADKLMLNRDKDREDIEKIKECNGISEERIKKIPLPIVKKVKLVGDNLEFTTTMPRIKLDIPKRQKSMGFINIGTILLLIAVVVCFILGNR